MNLRIIDGEFAVCRPEGLSGVRLEDDLWFLARTDEEISLVCRAESVPADCSRFEAGWRMFRVEGELDFGLTGILANLSGTLAREKIPLFAVSTFNTDYILVQSRDFDRAAAALCAAGHAFNLR